MERFQLLVFMFLLFVYNVAKRVDFEDFALDTFDESWMRPLLGSLALIYFSELAVDW